MLFVLTLFHLAVDGVCGAALYAFATEEMVWKTILGFFATYTIIAFGAQGLAGLILDSRPALLPYSILLALLTLWIGAYSTKSFVGAVFLGIGNCLFHVAGGKYILEHTTSFTALGVFVSSGAIGLALGLEGFVGALFFLVLASFATLFVLYFLAFWPSGTETSDDRFHLPIPNKQRLSRLGCLILLLACIVLRGFGGKGSVSEYVLLLPCIFALGKMLGGILCDRIGFQKTLLTIFLGGFVALQCEGFVPFLLVILAFNMTMPLTLKLAYSCFPKKAGCIFGLCASCLVPGAFFAADIALPPQAMLTLAFLTLFAAGALLGFLPHTPSLFQKSHPAS